MNSNSNNSKTRKKDLNEQYPNEAKFIPGEKMKLNPDNYFHGMPLHEVRKKYTHFTVHMEAINKALELPINASIEDLSRRIYDLVYAANQEG